MKNYKSLFFTILSSFLLVYSCTSDDLAFDVIESPVLAVFDIQPAGSSDMLSMTAAFYDLDKSGILDQNIGIDSIPIEGLEVSVFVEQSALISTHTTDASGMIEFEANMVDLGTSRKLEWVGSYEGTPFRIYKTY